jgi:3-deoxy-7-phosphoheptulonate synthase
MKKWSVNSWRNYEAKHLPEYPDVKKLEKTEDQLRSYPPLVFAGEARDLKRNLAKVSEVKHFYCKVVIVRKVLMISMQII